MSWSVEHGISDGSDPDADITRKQFATMLWRYAGSPSGSGGLSGFSDADSVSSWAVPAMDWAVSAGLMVGSDGKLNPTSSATRAETATLLMRFCENITK